MKDISCECKCTFDGKDVIQINGGITINVYVSVKNGMYVKKIQQVKIQKRFRKTFSKYYGGFSDYA